MIDKNKKYKTRSGLDVEILKVGMNRNCPVLGVVTNQDETESPIEWYDDGKCKLDMRGELDLIEVKEKRGFWLNVYPFVCMSHKTKIKADTEACDGRIACVYVEFEEGEGL